MGPAPDGGLFMPDRIPRLPRKSQTTISNAMDVGNPSNFVRMLELYQDNHRLMSQEVAGISINDKETRNTIKNIYENTGFILDPHTAVGVAAAVKSGLKRPTLVLATAHPSKFVEAVEPVIKRKLNFPSQLTRALKKSKKSTIIKNDLKAFKKVLFHNATL